MLLGSFSRIIKFNCQKLCLERVEIIIINSSVRVGMWMIQNTFAEIESDWTLSEGFQGRVVVSCVFQSKTGNLSVFMMR